MYSVPNGLRGRGDQWALVVDLLAAATGGHAMLLVEGAPGMGRSRLLDEAAEAAAQHGFVVVRTSRSADRLEILGDPPPTLTAPDGRLTIADLAPWVAELVLWKRDTGATPPSYKEHCAARPIFVALDDVDTLSPDSVRALSALSGKLSDIHMGWMLSARAGGDFGELEAAFLAAGIDVASTALRPLAEPAVEEILADMLGVSAHHGLVDFAAGAKGSPLFLVELIEGLREEGRISTDDGTGRLASDGIPHRFQEFVQRRLRSTSPRSWQLIRVAAVLGRLFRLSDVAELMRETTATLLPTVDALLAAGLLDCADDRVTFRHDLVWRSVVESIPPSVRRALHGDIERVRDRQLGEPANRVAASDSPVADRDTRAVSVVHALAVSGELTRAVTVARATLARSLPDALAADLRSLLANILVLRGEGEQALAAADAVLAMPDVPGDVAAVAAAGRVVALFLTNDPRAGTEAETILAGGRPNGIDTVAAANVMSTVLWRQGRLADGLRWARHGSGSGGAGNASPQWWLWQQLGLITKLAQLREFDEAELLMCAMRGEIDTLGLAGYEGNRGIARAQLLMLAGRLQESAREARAGLAAARTVGTPLLVPVGLTVLATVALRAGDTAAARWHLRECESVLAESDCLPSPQYDWVSLQLTAELHGARRAAGLVESRLSDLATGPALFVAEPGAAAWLVRLATSVGDAELARVVLATAQRLAMDNPGFPTVAAGAAHARGLYERDLGLLARVVAEHKDPWAAAWARSDLNQIRELTGSDPAADTLPARLPPADRRWDALSEIERSIAFLVSEGLTNRQIARRVRLSPHTVNYHLRGMFRKLDVSSRVELARHVPPEVERPAS